MSEFLASSKCPACDVAIGRVPRDPSKRGAKWYRLAPRTFRCPTCLAAVHPVTRPAGYALLALIALLVLGMNAAMVWPGVSREQFAMVLAGGGALMLLLAVACSRFGFHYRLPLATAPLHASNPAQERYPPDESS